MMQFYTIGVYNSTADEFFGKLTKNKIDTFCDIRMRRAVRGATYAFVNSNRLQQKLEELGIKYEHITGLAPTPEIRAVQVKADKDKGDAQRSRETIDPSFAKEYKLRILDKFDIKDFVEHLESIGAKKIVLFCVEEHPEACHRSIVAKKLEEKYEAKVKHL